MTRKRKLSPTVMTAVTLPREEPMLDTLCKQAKKLGKVVLFEWRPASNLHEGHWVVRFVCEPS